MMTMKIFRVTDPQINARVGDYAAADKTGALDQAVAPMGWDSYAEYVADAEKLLGNAPRCGIRTLEAVEVVAALPAAVILGRLDRMAGLPLTANPFPQFTRLNDLWFDGWLDGQDLDEISLTEAA